MDELNKKLDEIVSRLGELYDTQLEQVHRYYFLDSESDDYDNIQNLMHDPKIVYDNYSLNLSEILIETGYKIISNISHYIFYSLASLTVFMKQGEGEIELEGLDLAIGSDVIVNLNKNLDLGVSITDDIFDSLTKSEMILSKNHESVPHYVSYLVDQGYSKNLLKNDDVLTKVSVSYYT